MTFNSYQLAIENTGPKVKFPLLLELQDRSMARYVEFPLLVQY